jgi:RNA polymerase sigma factor (sigma-70 family)
MINEQTVLEGCRNKDRTAQRKLYEHFAGKMFAVCQRYVRSRFEAEDVLQDAFVKVFMQIDSFRNECPLEAWIRRIMVNTAISYLRKEKIWHEKFDSDTAAEGVPDVDSMVLSIDYEQLLSIVREIPAGCQAVFNLFAIEGYGHQEIAELLHISEGTSKSQYSRAKQLLQQKLSPIFSEK